MKSTLPRRRIFVSIVSVSTAAIAGCSSGDDSGGTPTPSPTPAPTTPNEEALEHYEAAIDGLAENKETLDEWAASSYEANRVETLQERVSTVRDDLDAAESAVAPSGDLFEQIEQAKLIADFQELILAYYEAVSLYFQFLSEGSDLGDNELHERAANTFAEAQGMLEDARTVIEDMGTVLEAIDNSTLNEPALEYTGEPLDHLDLADRQAIDSAESYAVAYENIHLSFVRLEAGQEHYENEEFTDAREEWETGRQRATDAKTAFESTIDNDYTPENLRQDSIDRLGDAESIIEAFDNFVDGAQEAEDGNIESATDLVREGFNSLEEL